MGGDSLCKNLGNSFYGGEARLLLQEGVEGGGVFMAVLGLMEEEMARVEEMLAGEPGWVGESIGLIPEPLPVANLPTRWGCSYLSPEFYIQPLLFKGRLPLNVDLSPEEQLCDPFAAEISRSPVESYRLAKLYSVYQNPLFLEWAGSSL